MLYPARYSHTPDEWPTDGDKLIEFMSLVMPDIQLDEWQSWLLKQILKRYPHDYEVPRLRGRLCYRQVLVSMPRQQGKSLLGAALGLYGLLLHVPDSYVIGVASSREQAVIVYQRVLKVINNNPALKRRFTRLTDTRGISNLEKTRLYEMKAAKGAALQGLPITLCVYDEIHITKPEMWSAVVLGTTTFNDGIVFGITTAGDDHSHLLQDLYKRSEGTVEAQNERFGYFIWEAPTDDLTRANVLASNPAVECGRISIDDVMSDVLSMPPSEAIRYRLNRFVKSSNPWVDPMLWTDTETQAIAEPQYVCIDRSPKWGYASITTAQRSDVITTTGRWSKANPTEDDLYEASKRFWGGKFIMDGYALKSLGERLKAAGQTVHFATRADIINANQLGYANLANKRLLHTANPAVTVQALAAEKKSEGEDWRVVGKSEPIDLIMGMLLSAWYCETDNEVEIQIF
jgi:Phage Terminase